MSNQMFNYHNEALMRTIKESINDFHDRNIQSEELQMYVPFHLYKLITGGDRFEISKMFGVSVVIGYEQNKVVISRCLTFNTINKVDNTLIMLEHYFSAV